YEKMNFHDFINKYRVEEFKKLAKESPHYSILALAFEAGFNSKSSFNSNFKNHTGETPSHYISNN
ncbi:MAG: AraC family transcriptional regulator, partial [Methanophagales archaeon]|nr:AraC family transcriptional regulator [Methanophagales archaeon]